MKPTTPANVTRALRASERVAAGLLTDKIRTEALAAATARRTRGARRSPIKSAFVSLAVFPRLLRAYARREFTEIPWQSILTLAGAALYFVSPIDLVPDFVPLAGLIDDTLVIELAVVAIRKDLDAFLAWEKRRRKRS